MQYIAWVARPDGEVDALTFPFWPGAHLHGFHSDQRTIQYALVAIHEGEEQTLLVYAPEPSPRMN